MNRVKTTLMAVCAGIVGCTVCHAVGQQHESPATPALTRSVDTQLFAPAADVAPKALVPVEDKEDWSVLKADRAGLMPLSYAVIGKAELPDFTRELLRVQWRVGDAIDLYVITPHGAVKPPVVLYLYSYPLEGDQFRDDGWCKRATKDGFAAVGFVSALTGQRYANRPMKEWFLSELQESLGSTTHDVQMILNYLQVRGDLDMSDVGMFGEGSGASIAVLAAAADPRIKTLDLLNPWGDWPEWLKSTPVVPDDERAKFLEPVFLKRVETLDPMTYLPGLQLKALRVQQLDTDAVTPALARAKIAAAVPQGHLVSYKDPQAYLAAWRVSGLSGWLHEQIRPQAAAQVASGR